MSDEAFSPLTVDTRGRRSRREVFVRNCPECGKPLKARSEKQWEFVYYAHKTLSKRHKSRAEQSTR